MNLCYVCGRGFKMPVPISLKLQSDFTSYFQTNVMREISKKLDKSALKINAAVKKRIQDTVREMLILAPEVMDLIGGSLQGQLGVTNPHGRLTAIVDTWVESIQVSTVVYSGAKKAGPLLAIQVGILRQGYGDVLSLPESSYESVGARGVFLIEWLKWLLLEGDKTIVDYTFLPGNRRGSRTGLGIMVQITGRKWSIPPQFRGTENDNFATRALSKLDKAIDLIVQAEMTRILK